jgi:hypothetical protein
MSGRPVRLIALPGRSRDTAERVGEPVGVALASHLAIADDIDTGAFHLVNATMVRVVLRLLEPRLGDSPHLARTHARRWPLGEVFTVD